MTRFNHDRVELLPARGSPEGFGARDADIQGEEVLAPGDVVCFVAGPRAHTRS